LVAAVRGEFHGPLMGDGAGYLWMLAIREL